MFLLQNVIHYLEVGAGGRFFSRGFSILMSGLILFVLALAYNLCAFKNFSSKEAMDSAQLARKLEDWRCPDAEPAIFPDPLAARES